jgi:hypothetical protein
MKVSEKAKKKDKEEDDDEHKGKYFSIPFLSWLTNLKNKHSFIAWCAIRFFFSIYSTQNMLQADQWW